MAKYLVCIADDFEVFGNLSGDVVRCQYIPSSILLKLAKEFSIKLTFMVEVLQQMKYKEFSYYSNNII
jgi:hypothetical protein